MTREIDEAPHSAEAEKGVLSSMLQGGAGVIEDVQAVLRPGAFYVPAHMKYFVYICAAHGNGMALDLITFTQTLRDERVLEELGGPAALTELFTFVPTPVNVDYYVEIVRDKWVLRELIRHCTDAVRRALDQSNDPKALLEEIQSDIIEIGQLSSTTEALQHISEAVPEVVASIEATYRRRGKPIGLSSGFPDLDRMTGGFQKGRTYYFPARPAMGKSSLGTEFAEHVAIDNAEKQVPVAIFSVEMTTHELTEVMLCRRSKVDLVRLRDGFFSKEGREEVDRQAERLTSAPLYIDDKGDLTIYEFRARARRAVLKFGVKLIIIDYIQRMKSTSKRAQMSRELEMSEIAQGISQTAKELQVPIIVLAQLNRETEKRKEGMPELADIRESGSMEAEAHFVGLLYRPSYYAKSLEKLRTMAEKYEMTEEAFKELAEVIIAKQRRGPVGTVRLRFIKEFAAFESEDEERKLYSGREEERQQKDEDL